MNCVLVKYLFFCIIASSGFRIGYCQTTYNVMDYGAAGDGRNDDSQAFWKAWEASCVTTAENGTSKLVIPGGRTFLLQPIQFYGPCKPNSMHVEIWGRIEAPENPDAWKSCGDSWLSFSNVTNLVMNGTGEINGQGSLWWSRDTQLKYVNNKVQCQRPKALCLYKCDNLQLSGLTVADSPMGHVSIDFCNNVTASNLTIRAPKDSPNTDGIDISMSTHLNIHDCNIGNGDDCIAVNKGSSRINISNIACGPGHGISVGSLGKDETYATVEDVYVRNCSFNGTQNGARIKTWQGGSGYARRITFEQITLIDTENPIIIDQNYCNGRHDCKNSTLAVNVSDVTYNGFHGTCEKEQAIVFECSQTVGCVNIVMKQINITSAIPNAETQASCSNANGTSSATVPQVPCLQTY